jgi:membrane associated rhomboid family serine protease
LGLNIFFFQEELYYQVISTIFTHGTVEHLIMNMLVLWQFGNLVAQYTGSFRFLILYLIGGILTSILTLTYLYYSNDWGNVVGASGAISVLFGYVALKDKTQRKGIIILILLISFVPILFGYNIAWYSHLIGFMIGVIFGYFL